jgi:Leucine Rich repeat
MTRADTYRSEQPTAFPPAHSSSRHFPTFHLFGNCFVAVQRWFWQRRRGFASATVVTALLLVVLYGCWESAIGPQRDAVKAIQEARGFVSYDWEWSNGQPKALGREPPWPKWVVKTLGPDFCGHVVAVHLNARAVDDALMIHIAHLTRLKYLYVFGGRINGNSLAHLENLTELETLGLFPVSDDDLAHIRGLTKLKSLDLSGEQITNKGLAHLAEMRQMESLRLVNTRITTLEPIRGLTKLKELNLAGSPIVDDGLKPLAGFTNLRQVSLARSRVTNAGIAHFSSLSNLIVLDLGHTTVGDPGVRLLLDLPRIMHLNLLQTRVTDAGLAGLAERINRGSLGTLSVAGPKITLAGVTELRKKLARVQVIGPDGIVPPRPSRSLSPPASIADEELPR